MNSSYFVILVKYRMKFIEIYSLFSEKNPWYIEAYSIMDLD